MKFSTEVTLLFLCARTQLNEEQRVVVRRFAASHIDWWILYNLAVKHGVVALVYTTLDRVCRDLVPANVLEHFKHDVQWLVRRNLLLLQELLRLTEALNAHQIRSIAYKGPLLAIAVYSNIGLREFGDLDILIHKHDFARAKQVLYNAGYVPDTSIDTSDATHLQHHHDYRFVHQTTGLVVELQWGVMQVPIIFPPHLDTWWMQTETVQISGKHLVTLLPERLLLILCVHGAKHLWERLRWICDIAEMLRAYPQLDWEAVLQLARETHSERMLLLGLILARDLLGAHLPTHIEQQAERNDMALSLAAEVKQQLAMLAPTSTPSTKPFFYLRMMDRLYDRLRFCVYCYPSLLHPRRAFQLYGFQPFKYLLKE